MNCISPRRKYGENATWLWSGQCFFGCDTKSTCNENKNQQVGLYQTKKNLLHNKRNNRRNKKVTYRMVDIFSSNIFYIGLLSKIYTSLAHAGSVQISEVCLHKMVFKAPLFYDHMILRPHNLSLLS